MTVIFFGTSNYCLPVLDSLKKNFDLTLVVTRPDKPIGRKKILTPSATKVWAKKNNIPIDEKLNQDCDLGIVADFGRIIPEEEFSRPRLGTFNIHFSKLPDLRGASPIQACLLRGDTTAWITIFKLEKTLDTGPILWQKSYPILPEDTAESLYIRLFTEVAKELPNLFLKPETWNLIPQSGSPTFCKKLSREDGFVDYSSLLEPRTYNLFRAFYPWPGIWTIAPSGVEGPHKNKRLKILKCHLENEKLVLDEVQFEGEKPKPWPPLESKQF